MRGGVTFDVDGAAYELRFTTNAICRVEERGGKSLQDVLADAAVPGKRTLAYRLLLWAGIGGITMDAAGDLMDDLGPEKVDRLLADALRMAFPARDESDAGNGVAAP